MQWFCHDIGTGYLIDSSAPADGDEVEIIDTWDRFTFLPKSFFGLTNEKGETLQFRRLEDERMLIDIPDEDRKGSWQAFGGIEYARRLMIQFLKYAQLPPMGTMKFSSWY